MQMALQNDSNVTNLHSALDWIFTVIHSRFSAHRKNTAPFKFLPFSYCDDDFSLSRFLQRQTPTSEEFAILVLALVPHLQPDFFSKLIAEHLPEGGEFPEFGGVKSGNHRGILPTGETAQFVLAGDNLKKRLDVQRILGSEHWFWRKRILWLEPVREGEPAMSGRLVLNQEIVEELTMGKSSKPRFSAEFPAEYIETRMDWEDVVLHPNIMRQIHEIENWIKHNDTLLYDWGMEKNQAGLPRPVLRASGHGQDLDRHPDGQAHRQRSIPHRSVARGLEIYRRDRKEPGKAV